MTKTVEIRIVAEDVATVAKVLDDLQKLYPGSTTDGITKQRMDITRPVAGWRAYLKVELR